jgi:hypothetical protein
MHASRLNGRTNGSDRPSADPSWQTSAAESLSQTESLFAENHEPFFNSIDPFRSFVATVTIHQDFEAFVSARLHF